VIQLWYLQTNNCKQTHTWEILQNSFKSEI